MIGAMQKAGGSFLLKALIWAASGYAVWQLLKPSTAAADPVSSSTHALTGLVLGKLYAFEIQSPADYRPDQVVDALRLAGFSEIAPGEALSQFNGLKWNVRARWVSPADHTTVIAPFTAFTHKLVVES